MAELTQPQLRILRHAIGLDRSNVPYRNRFVTGPGTVAFPHCEELVRLGLMARRDGNELTGGDTLYRVTDEGRDAVREDRMAEHISDERLRQVRALVDFPSGHPVNCHPVNHADVAGLIARLDRAEAKLERIKKIVDPGQYLSLGMLVEIKEIVHG